MATVNRVFRMLVGLPLRLQLLTVSLAIVTGVVFGVTRFLQEYDISTGIVPDVLLSGVVIATIVGVFVNAYQNSDLTSSAIIALGSPIGVGVYLFVYHLFRPPSTDSPTWLLFLIYMGFFLFIGGFAHAAGLALDEYLN